MDEEQHDPPARLNAKGERLVDKVPQNPQWKAMTFLAALRNDRIDAPCLFDGPISGQTPPRLCRTASQAGAETRRRHESSTISAPTREKRYARRSGMSEPPHPLPKYPRNLNPIEQVFAKFKTLLRKAEARTHKAISACLREKSSPIIHRRMRRIPQERRIRVDPKATHLRLNSIECVSGLSDCDSSRIGFGRADHGGRILVERNAMESH